MAEDTDEERLRLQVSVGEITVEVDGPIDEAETWFEGLREDYLSDIDTETLNAAANGSSTVSRNPEGTQETDANTSSLSSGKSRSLSEYYKNVDNPTKRDSALIVGWYLEYHEGQDDFTRQEVEERAQDAKISLGANVSRDLSNQVQDGHLEKVNERDGKDAYHLTLTGEEYVEGELLGSQE
jgi:hypothetical protein